MSKKTSPHFELLAVNPFAATNPEQDILTPAQAAGLLQVKGSWIYEQTRERAGIRNPDPFPYVKIGRYLRFVRSEVLAWLLRQRPSGKRPHRRVA